jgi:hypothetical protein
LQVSTVSFKALGILKVRGCYKWRGLSMLFRCHICRISLFWNLSCLVLAAPGNHFKLRVVPVFPVFLIIACALNLLHLTRRELDHAKSDPQGVASINFLVYLRSFFQPLMEHWYSPNSSWFNNEVVRWARKTKEAVKNYSPHWLRKGATFGCLCNTLSSKERKLAMRTPHRIKRVAGLAWWDLVMVLERAPSECWTTLPDWITRLTDSIIQVVS